MPRNRFWRKGNDPVIARYLDDGANSRCRCGNGCRAAAAAIDPTFDAATKANNFLQWSRTFFRRSQRRQWLVLLQQSVLRRRKPIAHVEAHVSPSRTRSPAARRSGASGHSAAMRAVDFFLTSRSPSEPQRKVAVSTAMNPSSNHDIVAVERIRDGEVTEKELAARANQCQSSYTSKPDGTVER